MNTGAAERQILHLLQPFPKFGLLTDECDRLGAGYIVTGHYARVVFDGNSGRYLLKGKGSRKGSVLCPL